MSLLIYGEKNLKALHPELKTRNLNVKTLNSFKTFFFFSLSLSQNQIKEFEELMIDIKELRVKNLASCKDLQTKDEKGVIQKIDQLNIDGKTLLNVKNK